MRDQALRISGPAVADPGILRDLASQVEDILAEAPLSAYSRTNWRERVQKLVRELSSVDATVVTEKAIKVMEKRRL